MNLSHFLYAIGSWDNFIEFSKLYCESEAKESGNQKKTKPAKFRHFFSRMFGDNFNTNTLKAFYDKRSGLSLYYVEGRTTGDENYHNYLYAISAEDAERHFVENTLDFEFVEENVDIEDSGYIIEECRKADPFELFQSEMTESAKSIMNGETVAEKDPQESNESDNFSLDDYDLSINYSKSVVEVFDEEAQIMIGWAEPCPENKYWHWNIQSVEDGHEIESGATPLSQYKPGAFAEYLATISCKANIHNRPN